MKKISVLMIILVLAAASAFPGGKKEAGEGGQGRSVDQDGSH